MRVRQTSCVAATVLIAAVTIPAVAVADTIVPIVDGSDSIAVSTSLIVVRERYFETADISGLGLLESAGPPDMFQPSSPPMGSANAQRVQSLFVRVSAGGLHAGRITFSEGVSILGLVSDLEGAGGVYIWGARPNQGAPASQLATSREIFDVGMNYSARAYWAYDVAGTQPRKEDSFSLDRESREVTFSALAPLSNTCDDFRILISYNEDIGPNESFDVVLTEGSGLDVGAIHLGDGQEFYGVPLTVPEPSTLILLASGALGLLGLRRKACGAGQ